jgi:hypothetical protein
MKEGKGPRLTGVETSALNLTEPTDHGQPK